MAFVRCLYEVTLDHILNPFSLMHLLDLTLLRVSKRRTMTFAKDVWDLQINSFL